MKNRTIKRAQEKQQELEKLKSEILQEIRPSRDEKRPHWGSSVVTGLLVLLAFFSIVQAVQTTNIMRKINSGAIKTSAGSSALPSSLQDLPDMVGGC